MEKDSPSKPSVAELAGRFKGHILPMPNSNDELPFRRRPPPCSLKLQNQTDDNEESDKSMVSQKPFKIKMKNSAIIEKLQANLALSPTALLPSPKSPEVKLQPAPLSPTTPCSPVSPLSPTLRSSEEEDRISFDSPPEGTPLPSINKTRARLSFKRRLPTRQHRRSAGEEAGAFGSGLSPTELHSPKENGDEEQVFSSPTEEEAESGQLGALKEAKNKEDCENTEAEVEKADLEDRRDPEEEEVEQEKSMEASEEEEEQPPKQTDGVAKTEEEMPQQGGGDRE